MNSQKNDYSWAIILGFIMAALWLILVAIYAIAVFISLLLTVVAIFSWNRPHNILGDTTNPAGCRSFVLRGVGGAYLLPLFAVFCSYIFDTPVPDGAWLHLALAGYALGSLGIELLIEDSALDSEQTVLPPLNEAPDIKPAKQPERDYPFADWLDADEIR